MQSTPGSPTPSLQVTEIRISLRDDPKLKAFASVTLSSCFVVRGLMVVEGERGFFVAMPARKRPDGTYQDIAHPINGDVQRYLQEEVMRAYWKEMGKGRAPVPALVPPKPDPLVGRMEREWPPAYGFRAPMVVRPCRPF